MLPNMVNYMNKTGQSSISQSSTVQWNFQSPNVYLQSVMAHEIETPDTYVCSRCSRDKESSKKFSNENSMIPSPSPPQLQGLTQIEEMLIARAPPIMRVYIKPGGQRGYSGHCINIPQNVTELASSLPRYSKDLSVIIVKIKGRDNTCDETVELDVDPPTDTPSEDQVYDVSTEISGFLPLGEQQQQE